MLGATVKRILSAFRDVPLEAIAALWRLLLVLLLALLRLLALLWRILRRRKKSDVRRARCCKVPEHVKRKPDPCLYAQFYLRALGLSVTWDNPDIWITHPDGAPADSSALAPDTDYRIHVRIHDASFDPALGTEVRCFYRPWSFNHPDRTPIELLPDGTEKVVVLHIPPWSHEVAVFDWHTPDVDSAHYCLQAECRHPDDKNPNNNLGQENTNVVRASAGESTQTMAMLFNPTDEERRFLIEADAYAPQDDEVELRLRSRVIPLRAQMPFDTVHRKMLSYDSVGHRLATQDRHAPTITRYAYAGWDEIAKRNAHGAFRIGPEWQPTIDGQALEAGRVAVVLGPGETRQIVLGLTVPAGLPAGHRQLFNYFAMDGLGKPFGGVTLGLEVT